MNRTIALSLICVLGMTSLEAAVFYGKASGTGAALKDTITWYADEACTSTASVAPPYAAGAADHQYVILGSQKVQATSEFPDVTTYFGTDGVTVGSRVQPRHAWNMNAGLTLTFPHVTVFSSYFQINSDGITKFLGDYTFVKTSETIEFAGVHIPEGKVRGAELAGKFSGAEDVAVYLSGISANKVTATSTMKLTGDFSSFKGSFVAKDMTFDPYSRGEKILDVQLLSPTALGDESAPRSDALVLSHDSHLTMSDTVVQSGRRGITLNLHENETNFFNAASGKDWTLTTPLTGGQSGLLVKEGAGKVTLNGSTEFAALEVREGTLELGFDFTFATGATVTVKPGARIRSTFPEGLNIVLEEGAESEVLHQTCYATSTSQAADVLLCETEAWSDGQVAHAGADYVINNGAYYATASGWTGDMTFPGESLELANGSRLIMRTVRTVFKNLILNGGTRLQSAGCYLFTTPHVIRGKMTVQGSTSVDLTGNFGTNASGQQNRNAYQIEAEIVGDGWLNFGGGHPHANFSIVSANPAYKGRVSMGIGGSADLPISIEFAEPTSFGGPLDAFKKDAVWLRSSYNGLKPRNSMVFDAANRGIYFEESGAFIETPAGVEFTVNNTITQKKGLRKCGAGTLVLGAKIVPESADIDRRTLKIEAGYVKGTKANAAEDLILDFAAGTGLAVDAVPVDETVRTHGLCMLRTDCFQSPGTIPVRLDNAAELVARRARMVVPICTVPAAVADLSSVFVCEKPGPRYTSKILKETLSDGRVRYTADFSASGLAFIIR